MEMEKMREFYKIMSAGQKLMVERFLCSAYDDFRGNNDYNEAEAIQKILDSIDEEK